MEIKIPKVIRPLPLADYAPEYGDTTIDVWVNPPRAKLTEYQVLLDGAWEATRMLSDASAGESTRDAAAVKLDDAGNKIQEWMSDIWSQGSDPTRHLSVLEVSALVQHSLDQDPGLWPFLTGRTVAMIREWRERSKKA